MNRVALYTFGITRRSATAAQWQDFRERALIIYARAESAAGYVAHAAKPDGLRTSFVEVGQDFGRWGIYAIPKALRGVDAMDARRVIATLSIWRDPESARRFVYAGAHGDALKARSEWFEKGDWPGYVFWPIANDDIPTWADGVRKLELLATDGDAHDRFTFASPGSGIVRKS